MRSCAVPAALLLAAALAGCSGPAQAPPTTSTVLVTLTPTGTISSVAMPSLPPQTTAGSPSGTGLTSASATSGGPTTPASPSAPATGASSAPASSFAWTSLVRGDQLVSFVSPSGGTACRIFMRTARCDVDSPTFTAPPRPAGTTGRWGDSVTFTVGHAGRFTAHTDAVLAPTLTHGSWWQPGKDPAVAVPGGTADGLGYGHHLRSPEIDCVVDPSSGVTCRSLDGRHGFIVSRSAHTLW